MYTNRLRKEIERDRGEDQGANGRAREGGVRTAERGPFRGKKPFFHVLQLRGSDGKGVEQVPW